MSDKKQTIARALRLGASCTGIYIANYVFRSLLSVATPLMLQEQAFTNESVAVLSSVYMLAYALGQLVNGPLGDYVNPRIIVGGGLVLAGIGMLVFPSVSALTGQAVCFALLGCGLSALRGPLVKMLSENTEPDHARFICVLISGRSLRAW